jgi:hypothetical protein
MSRVLAVLLVVPVLAACNGYAAPEGQSISSLQGNADDDQIEYGPSDLSAQSDASMAAVAALDALLDGGPDAVTPTGLSAIEPSLTYVKSFSKRPGTGKRDLRQQRSWNRRDVAIGYVLLVEVLGRRRCPDLRRGKSVHRTRCARCGKRGR